MHQTCSGWNAWVPTLCHVRNPRPSHGGGFRAKTEGSKRQVPRAQLNTRVLSKGLNAPLVGRIGRRARKGYTCIAMARLCITDSGEERGDQQERGRRPWEAITKAYIIHMISFRLIRTSPLWLRSIPKDIAPTVTLNTRRYESRFVTRLGREAVAGRGVRRFRQVDGLAAFSVDG